MDKGGQVASVIRNHVKGLPVREGSKSLFNAPVVFLLSLALPREDRDASRGNAI